MCPFQDGNAKLHVCRYHGWSYDAAGINRAITDEQDGQYPVAFKNANHNLINVARFGNYRGLLFASLCVDVPSLEEYLGDARIFLDIVLDQSENGFEFVPGPVIYTYDGNWKLQFENGLDFYHFNLLSPKSGAAADKIAALGPRLAHWNVIGASNVRKVASSRCELRHHRNSMPFSVLARLSTYWCIAANDAMCR